MLNNILFLATLIVFTFIIIILHNNKMIDNKIYSKLKLLCIINIVMLLIFNLYETI